MAMLAEAGRPEVASIVPSQPSQLFVQEVQCILERDAVHLGPRSVQLTRDAGARQLEALPSLPALDVLRRQVRTRAVEFLALLRFDGLAFPPACHMETHCTLGTT